MKTAGLVGRVDTREGVFGIERVQRNEQKGPAMNSSRVLGFLLAVVVGVITGCSLEQAWAEVQEAPCRAKNGDVNTVGGLDMLFVLHPNVGFLGYENPATLGSSHAAVTTTLAMSPETVLAPRDVALDACGALYFASGARGGAIAVYDDPRLATGSRRPDRRVSGKATRVASPIGLAIDQEKHLLYVLLRRSAVQPTVVVFDISTPHDFNGEVAPLRTFQVAVTNLNAQQVRCAHGSLYMVNMRGDTAEILAFDRPETLHGSVVADRVLTSAALQGEIHIEVDAKDRLLVSVPGAGQVQIYAGASQLAGPVAPSVTFTIAGTTAKPQPTCAITDAQDRLYLVDAFRSVIYAFDHTSTLSSGQHSPDREIDTKGAMVPKLLLLLER
jgi:hypothetical protein